MKKSILCMLGLAGLLGMASCSEELDAPAANDGGKAVNVTVNLPLSDNSSRAIPEIPAGYKLRCIMQLLDAQGNPMADKRVVNEVAAGAENVRFSFVAPADGYQGAMFWADYVKDLDQDYLYTTTDLKAVGYNAANVADAFNNPAADAFYGYMLSGNTSITLERPFTRLTFKCADNAYAAYTNVKVTSMAAPAAFNVVNGSTNGFDTSVASNDLAVGADGVWFSTYLFVGDNAGANLGEGNNIALTLTGAEPALNLTVKGENVPLTRNYDITAMVSATSGDITDITVEFPGGMVDPDRPREIEIGDYVNADGTYSAVYDAAKAVAIVYAVDDTKAYAFSLDNTSRVKLFGADDAYTGTVAISADLYAGPFTSQYWTDFVTATASIPSALRDAFNEFVSAHPMTGSGLSAWYTPCPSEMKTIIGMMFNDGTFSVKEGTEPVIDFPAQNPALVAAFKTANGADAFFSVNGTAVNFFTGVVGDNSKALCVQLNEADKTYSSASAKLSNPMIVRPVLTLNK